MIIKNENMGNFFRKIKNFKESGILIVLLGMYALVSILSPNFCSMYNFGVLLKAITYLCFIALAQHIVLLLGDIDLSVGAIAAFSGVICGYAMGQFGIPIVPSIIIGLGIGVLCGLLNGLIVTLLRVNALIATLGTQGIFIGLTLVITKGSAVMGLPKGFFFLGQKVFLDFIPLAFIIMIVALIIITIILRKTPFGRHIFAVGSNKEAARVVGLRVNQVKIKAFMMSGLLSSMAGILMVSRLTSAQPSIGDGWIMPSVAACVLGGTPLTGGEGSTLGVLIGVAILSIIENSIVLLGISPYWQTFVSGLVVVIAVAVDSMRQRSSLKKKILIEQK
ncbi:MAG: ABC transporter permease [Spirochaetales bacterium]|nr:ABC transporter permease [Spirochaetales bacterium]